MRSSEPWIKGTLVRYGVATVGPIGSAGAQFLLSFLLLQFLDAQDFGRFSFLLIASQFSWGIWSALFCAPLPVVVHNGGGEEERSVRAMDVACLTGSVLIGLLFAIIGLWLGEAPLSATLFAAYAALSLLRWYARAQSYVADRPLRTTASDLVYTLVILLGAGLLPFAGKGTQAVAIACGALALAAFAGLLPFGRAYFARQFLRLRWSSLSAYMLVWRDHARWSLMGVVTTEATANAHAYLVTLIFGPKAFAPIAASSLMIRPMMVAMNALTEFERPRMARAIGAGQDNAAWSALRIFRGVLLLGWLLSLGAMVALFLWEPTLVFPARYDMHMLAVASGLWMLVAAIRAARTPDSVMLQAAGAFRPLAFASLGSAVTSVVLVLGLIVWAGPVISIAGILAGEAAFALAIWRALGHWSADRKAETCPS